MDYSKVICVTNRHLVAGDFYEQMERVFALRPASVVVREKDLREEDYRILAERLMEMGAKHGVKVRLHTFYRVAIELGCDSVHLPLPIFEGIHAAKQGRPELAKIQEIGTSIHSMDDLRKAEKLGANYVTAGHIFETDCKSGLPGRGLHFLRKICRATDLPVYAIGGIDDGNMQSCIDAGAAGVCMMSGFMRQD